jgi:hypothetical protein
VTVTDEARLPEPDTDELTSWVFTGQPPTARQMLTMLAMLPRTWGVAPVDFADFVQLLPQSQKVKRPHPTNPKLEVEEYVDQWIAYFSVAGRIRMLNAAAELNGWGVDFEPEPVTPTGVPGYLMIEPRLVYREYVTITELVSPPSPEAVDLVVYRNDDVRIGRKPGAAWVPYSGGSQAAKSNPFEKVETSARGRALAAWGFGVLPGSGVASVEEMQGVKANLAGVDGEQPPQQDRRRASRETLISSVLTTAEQLRQLRGQPEEWIAERVAKFVHDRLGVPAVVGEGFEVDWVKLKDGQIQLLLNSLADAVSDAQAEAQQL